MKFLYIKYAASLLLAVLLFSNVYAGGGNEKGGINWMTWDEVQVAMKKQPKKVWVDVYTDWCGWCKVMDKKTFSHPEVIKYMNEHFYAVKFNAERKDEVMFMGKTYGFSPEHRANLLAAQLMGGQMSYPTNVFMDEHFQNPVTVPGYQTVPDIQVIFNYLTNGIHKKNIPLEEYAKTFKGSWQANEG